MADETLPSEQLKELLARIDPEVLQQVMPLTGGVITMMFTDIVDSTRIKAQIGDAPYFDVLQRHNELVRSALALHDGREVKTMGDAFLVGFAVPPNAVVCAVKIQQDLATTPIQTGQGPLKIRIGIHTGTPKVYRDPVSNRIDLSGTDADKAARVESLARGGQVLISEETKALARPKEVQDCGLWELQGLGRQRIYEVLWTGKTPERPSGRPWLEPVRFLTRFIGREAEISQIMDAVPSHRLVTLRGMGGIGKTRLAAEVATRVSQGFDDGVFFVELANVRDSEGAVIGELVAKLEVNPAGFPDEATALLATFQNRRALLVLDNFEAVMSAARFIGRLLRRCPGMRLLVTSQRLLGVDGEQQFEVLPMAAPVIQPDITPEALDPLDGFQLFRDRARLKKSDWEPSLAEGPCVAEILALTDGVPLSIELAAGWVGRISLPTLRDGLRRKRAGFLKRTGPTIEEKRHVSIQACIDWSFGLLLPEERELLGGISVFVGGFFPEDVAQVCGERNASAILDSLQAQSFLQSEESLVKTRYSMLPTVREYAVEKIGDKAEALRRRHSEHFLKVLDFADDQIRGKEQMAGIGRVSADLDNIRAGMEFVLEVADYRSVVYYAQAFENYLRKKARFAESLLRGQQGLNAAQALNDAKLIATCHNNLGIAYQVLPTGDRGANLQQAIACFEAALRVHTEREFPVDWAMTQNNLAAAYGDLPTGDRAANLKQAIACFEAALRVHTEREFPVQWATTQNNLGNAYRDLPTGDRAANLQRAIACYEAALRVYTEREFPVDWAMTQNNLGTAYQDLPTGDRGANIQQAIACYEAALRVYSEREFPVDWGGTQNNLGAAYRNLPTGDRGANLQQAIRCFEAALRVYTEREFPVDWAMTQNNLGTAYLDLPTGDRGANIQQAIACYDAALRVRTEREFPVDWAMTQNNLGTAYLDLPTGDRGANLAKAIACFEAAIRGYAAAGLTKEADEVRQHLAPLRQQE
jgi:predicted ATPase/class 3 adenylate cyclase